MTDSATPPAGRPVTMRDVAERAGVSKSLVSLVLRGAPHVSPTRRQLVLDTMTELGYRPNRLAQTLATSRSNTVGVLLNDLRNPWFVELLEGLGTALHSTGLAPVLADSRTDLRVGRRSVETLLAQGVDALVVVGTTSDSAAIAAAAESIPVVLAGTLEPRLPYVDIAVNDDESGARQATDHLISLGHQRIAHMRGPGTVGELRLTGYCAAMIGAGLDPDAYAEDGGMSEESGYAAARRLLARPDRPTAIFAFNDIAAIGTMSAAADQNLTIPQELSIVGYDNTYLAKIRHISLTSVDNGNFAVGVQAGRFLNERLDAPNLPARMHSVPTQLFIRGTTGRFSPLAR
ncbi:MAG: LacI family DNA-binding transcriptional regulator [Nakamurella sp.]